MFLTQEELRDKIVFCWLCLSQTLFAICIVTSKVQMREHLTKSTSKKLIGRSKNAMNLFATVQCLSTKKSHHIVTKWFWTKMTWRSAFLWKSDLLVLCPTKSRWKDLVFFSVVFSLLPFPIDVICGIDECCLSSISPFLSLSLSLFKLINNCF